MKHHQVGARVEPDGRVFMFALSEEEDKIAKAHHLELKAASSFRQAEKRHLGKMNGTSLDCSNNSNGLSVVSPPARKSLKVGNGTPFAISPTALTHSTPLTQTVRVPMDFCDISVDVEDWDVKNRTDLPSEGSPGITLDEVVAMVDRNTDQEEGFFGDSGSTTIANKGKSGNGRVKGCKRSVGVGYDREAAKRLPFYSPQLDPRGSGAAALISDVASDVLPGTPTKQRALSTVPSPPLKLTPVDPITSLPPLQPPLLPTVASTSFSASPSTSISAPCSSTSAPPSSISVPSSSEAPQPVFVEAKKEEGATNLAEIDLEYSRNLTHLLNLHKERAKLVEASLLSSALLDANAEYLNKRAVRDVYKATGRVEVIDVLEGSDEDEDIQTTSSWKPLDVFVTESGFRSRTALVLEYPPQLFSCKVEEASAEDSDVGDGDEYDDVASKSNDDDNE